MPYFSILLPTKNRSHLVGHAIRSVLQQDFLDFELIVCDNDDDESATRNVVNQFEDHRIKYIRTGGVDMVANWSQALDAASGDYITVLEDKMIFYPGALAEIWDLTKQSSSGVVVWLTDIFDDSRIKNRLVQFRPMGQVLEPSADILELVTNDILKYWSRLPRGLSCVVPMTVTNEIITKSGENFFDYMSPDLVSALKILAHVDELLTVYKSFTLMTSARASTGNNALLGQGEAQQYYSGKQYVKLSYDFVPVKNSSTVINGIVNDFRSLADRCGGDIRGYQVSHRNYVKMMTRELVVSNILARKMTWDKGTLIQLVKSEGKVVSNIFFILTHAVSLTFMHLLRNFGVGLGKKKRVVSYLDGDPINIITGFLSGRTDLGIVRGFSKSDYMNIGE